MPARAEQIEGGLIGLLVGDMVGVPYEFHDPRSLPPVDEIDYPPPAGFPRAHTAAPPGAWSDDGAQALCLLASLLDLGSFDPDDFGRRLVDWYRDGYMAVDGVVFDIGVTTAEAVVAISHGTPALKAGSAAEYANGNGSLMRVLPLALWHRGPDEELVRDAQLQSRVTHGHLRSQLCCALYCLWARRILEGARGPWDAAVETLRELYATDDAVAAELEAHIGPDELPEGHGSGYVVDSLHGARWAVEQGSYEGAVRAAISLGHDTDTTACVAGGIAGLRDGVEAIPRRWRDRLGAPELIEPLLRRLSTGE